MARSSEKDKVARKTRYDIFLSYASADRDIALEIEDRLRANGLKCFMAEKNLRGGTKWVPEIREALRASARVLLLITPRSISSTWVMLETGAAWMEGIEIVPIVQFIDPNDLSDVVRGFQARVIETEAQKTGLIHELARTEEGDIAEITFDSMLKKLRDFVLMMNEHQRFHPNLCIGSGRDGAVCAAILAELFGQEALKVVDCHFRGGGAQRVTLIDESSLRKEDIFNKNVLIVEWARQTGHTYQMIKKAVTKHGPADLRSYALFWTRVSVAPDFYGFQVTGLPSSPWGRVR